MNISNFNFQDSLKLLITKSQQILNMGNLDTNSITKTALTAFTIFFLSCIFLWLIKGVGLYTMAKNRNDKFAFLAFIPYACLYTEGKIVCKTKIFGIEIDHAEALLPILLISTTFPYTCPVSFFLLIISYFAILYRIYQEQLPNSAILLIILSIIFPIFIPFFIFFIRNRNNNTLNKRANK